MNIRIFEQPEIKTPFEFKASNEVYEAMKGYQKADREMMLLLLLDAKNHVMEIETHTIGAVDTSAVYPRELFKSAIVKNASSIILVHNHPSGDPEPSVNDKDITKLVIYGAELLGIKVLDHVILGAGRYCSFADLGLITQYEEEAEAKRKEVKLV